MELCKSKKHIAIFSSLNYHYEMFGYIIQFCGANDYKLTIFVDNINNNGWFGYTFLYTNGLNPSSVSLRCMSRLAPCRS